LREKLRQLTIRAASSVDEETATAMKSRKDFLQQQRDLLLQKQRNEREYDLKQHTGNTRPQSAADVARRAMVTHASDHHDQPDAIPPEVLAKRRAMANKLKQNVVNRQ
jgi:hypothetical protein